jgi:hypothetical protein
MDTDICDGCRAKRLLYKALSIANSDRDPEPVIEMLNEIIPLLYECPETKKLVAKARQGLKNAKSGKIPFSVIGTLLDAIHEICVVEYCGV